MKNGKLSTTDCAYGKARTVYTLDGYPHRLDGPAILVYKGDDVWNCYADEFWILGENYTFEDWNKHPLVVQHRNQQLIKYWKE